MWEVPSHIYPLQRAAAAVEVACGIPVVLELMEWTPIGQLQQPPDGCDLPSLESYFNEHFSDTCRYAASIQSNSSGNTFIEVRPGVPGDTTGCNPRPTLLDTPLMLDGTTSDTEVYGRAADHGLLRNASGAPRQIFAMHPEKTIREVLYDTVLMRENHRWNSWTVSTSEWEGRNITEIRTRTLGGPYPVYDSESGPFSYRNFYRVEKVTDSQREIVADARSRLERGEILKEDFDNLLQQELAEVYHRSMSSNGASTEQVRAIQEKAREVASGTLAEEEFMEFVQDVFR